MTATPPAVFVPADLAKIAGPADLIELRLDLLPKDVTPAEWVAAAPRPVLATVRSKEQGGLWRHGPETAAELLRACADAGAAWLDVEQAVAPHLGELPAGGPRRAAAPGGAGVDVAWALGDARFARVKLARPCDDARAFNALWDEARGAPANMFCVPYGKLASTRTLFAHERAFLYGAASEDAPAAPGQPTLAVLLDELRAGEVSRDADLFGLVGNPPSRSPSPALHNEWFRCLGRDALYVPLPGVPLEEAVGLPFEGFSVTMPAKEAAWHVADGHDAAARAAGVANTLVRTDTGWRGGNTDVTALETALGLTALIHGLGDGFVYGAGGYARAAPPPPPALQAAALAGRTVRVAARHERAAYDLAQAFDVPFAGSARYERQADDGVIINATPAGGDGAPVEAFAAADLAGLVVLDAPYAPRGQKTGLVLQAEAQAAAEIYDGRRLLAMQAWQQALQFNAVDLAPEDVAVMEPAGGLHPGTLVLVGARGAGKSTVGALVARWLGRPFVDTDEAVLRITGRTPAAWIEQDGWEAFRRVECDALERALARDGVVIATGGGAVEHEPSRALLAEAACVVHLDLPPAVAAERVAADVSQRPRLPGASDALHEAGIAEARRRPVWAVLAQHRVDATQPLDVVASAVIDCWPPAS
ncbi:MAG: type I 3-dehydroquinate dehydratase [Planctomycetota bacterium]|nr:type I 3-dehydroquinate dehydratase [Planctomycetota bacterium]